MASKQSEYGRRNGDNVVFDGEVVAERWKRALKSNRGTTILFEGWGKSQNPFTWLPNCSPSDFSSDKLPDGGAEGTVKTGYTRMNCWAIKYPNAVAQCA